MKVSPFAMLSVWLRRARSQISGLLAQKWKTSFYLYLAGAFTFIIIVDTAFLHVAANMRQGAFDMMVKYRLRVPKPDKDIVIVDINEASLAAMAKEYGRWPWPRQVMGEFVEQIEKQKPRAIVFDVLFSDPDVYNADSDTYFNAAIAGAPPNTFFPMLRLDSSDDKLSQIKLAMIPGAKPLDDYAEQDATAAIVLPFFEAALQGGRLGTHNIYPDADGIARQYPAYLDDYGWKLPSLPLRIAQELGYSQPDQPRVLLNWRGKPFTYPSVSFSDVFLDLGRKTRSRPVDEFKDKIVIIGSTAPSLFDIKATPIDRMFPGVEILATAIDNFKHGDFLRFPDWRWQYFLLTLCVIWGTAWGFYRDAGRDKIDMLFGASQFILIGISYASINFTTLYINLTGPVTLGLAYFTVARLYSFATGKALEHNAVRAAQQREGELHGVLLLVNLERHADVLNDGVREKLRLGLLKASGAASGGPGCSVEILKGDQRGLWDLFENIVAVSWLFAKEDDVARAAVAAQVEAVKQAAGPLVNKHCVSGNEDIALFVHEGAVRGGEGARESWRTLFAEALQRWSETKRGIDKEESA